MIKTITNIIKSKYYTYIPGEFMPIYSGTELINKKAFHAYKAKRALHRISRRLSYIASNLQASRA